MSVRNRDAHRRHHVIQHGRTLVEMAAVQVPILAHNLTADVDEKAFRRFGEMRARYGL